MKDFIYTITSINNNIELFSDVIFLEIVLRKLFNYITSETQTENNFYYYKC
jgi:hypothetical protein